MPFAISVRDSTGGSSQVQIDNTPDKCPICHLSIIQIDWAIGSFRANGQHLERLLQCPSATCRRLFLAQYTKPVLIAQYNLQNCVPYIISTAEHTETTKNISKDFCDIYDEAQKAEGSSLKLVAGPGYRKALEFLIKDYVISQITEENADKRAAQKTEVEKMPLATCIGKFVKSEQIKQIAKRAAWLGNDETHYVRKWEDKDLGDLKKLIELTLHWIEIEKLTADVIMDMPER